MGLFGTVSKFVHKHTPAILTAMGAAGVVSTAVLAGRAHADAKQHLRWRFEELGQESGDWMVKLKETWRFYIPPVASGVVSIVCIISAQSINSKRQAVLVGLVTLGQESLQEYREATREVVGPKKEQEIYDEIAERKGTNPSTNVAILDAGDILVEDGITGQMFGSTVEKIRKAQNDVMEMVLYSEGSASFNDFARAVGMTATDYGEEVGFTPDNKLEVVFSTKLVGDNVPVLVINYRNNPKFNYDGVW